MKYLNTYNEEINQFPKDWSNQQSLTERQFNKLLKENCSDYSPKDQPIYRSIALSEKYYIVKKTGERRSAYTKNYYTLLLNNLPSWSEYPKRTHICSNVKFNYLGDKYRVIPFNGAKIGICPGDDIQASFLYDRPAATKLYKYNIKHLEQLNTLYEDNFYRYLRILKENVPGEKLAEKIKDIFKSMTPDFGSIPAIKDNSWFSFRVSLKELYNKISALEPFQSDPYISVDTIKTYNNMLDLLDINKLNKLFDPKGLGFKCVTYNKYKTLKMVDSETCLHCDIDNMHEVWLDGDILIQRVDDDSKGKITNTEGVIFR